MTARIQSRPQAVAGFSAFRRALRRIVAWRDVRHSRAALLQLDDRLLQDVGLTRAEAMSEADRTF